MYRYLRAILTASKVQTPENLIKPLGLDLLAIEGALVFEHEVPRPQWKIIEAWIKENVSKEDVPQAWQEISLCWLRNLKNYLGDDYAIYQSTHFLLITTRRFQDSKILLRTCELTVKYLIEWLGPIAEKRGYGKHVILDFDTKDRYYDYVSYFYSGEPHITASGGIFFRKGYPHIALPPLKWYKDTVIHELTHNRLAHLSYPRWLSEGIAVTMERKIGGNKYGKVDREVYRKHQAYWSNETIAAFWSGESFRDPDAEVVHLSYKLADTLVDLLVQEFPNFLDFVAEANYEDAGEAAAQKSFRISLNDLVSTFLGPGEWISKFIKENPIES